jgi:hypothetical protein
MQYLTVRIDDQVMADAERVAMAMGKEIDDLIREYLESLTQRDSAEREVEEFRRLSAEGGACPKGWEFDRDEIHSR